MPSNRGVVYLKLGSVEVQNIDFPTYRNPAGKTIDHGVILKVVTTNICGSDQHMVRGRTTAPAGMVLGHEITGEVIEKGRDVEYLDIGDLVSVPFNVACGRCRTCRDGDTGVCLHVNSDRAGGAYRRLGPRCPISTCSSFRTRPFKSDNADQASDSPEDRLLSIPWRKPPSKKSRQE